MLQPCLDWPTLSPSYYVLPCFSSCHVLTGAASLPHLIISQLQPLLVSGGFLSGEFTGPAWLGLWPPDLCINQWMSLSQSIFFWAESRDMPGCQGRNTYWHTWESGQDVNHTRLGWAAITINEKWDCRWAMSGWEWEHLPAHTTLRAGNGSGGGTLENPPLDYSYYCWVWELGLGVDLVGQGCSTNWHVCGLGLGNETNCIGLQYLLCLQDPEWVWDTSR